MRLFVRILRKLETSCEIRGVLTPFYGGTQWLPLARSLSQYLALFVGIMSTKRFGAPILE